MICGSAVIDGSAFCGMCGRPRGVGTTVNISKLSRRNLFLFGFASGFGACILVGITLAVIIAVTAYQGAGDGLGVKPATSSLTFEELRPHRIIFSYDELSRNSAAHQGKIVFFQGEIVQVSPQANEKYLLRMNVTESRLGVWEDEARYDHQGLRVTEGDVVEIIGIVDGT